MQAKTTFKPMLAVDEVEQIHRKKLSVMSSNSPMPRIVTSSFKRKKQIDAMAALFNILVKDSTLA